jgi:hypothetical protein
MAMNLMVGDVVDGERISNIIKFAKRSRKQDQLKAATIGLLVVTPHPKGYDVNTRKFVGHERVTIQRPKKNRPRTKKRHPGLVTPAVATFHC